MSSGPELCAPCIRVSALGAVHTAADDDTAGDPCTHAAMHCRLEGHASPNGSGAFHRLVPLDGPGNGIGGLLVRSNKSIQRDERLLLRLHLEGVSVHAVRALGLWAHRGEDRGAVGTVLHQSKHRTGNRRRATAVHYNIVWESSSAIQTPPRDSQSGLSGLSVPFCLFAFFVRVVFKDRLLKDRPMPFRMTSVPLQPPPAAGRCLTTARLNAADAECCRFFLLG